MDRFNRAKDIFFSPVSYIGMIFAVTLICIGTWVLGQWDPLTPIMATVGAVTGQSLWAYFQAWLDEEHGEKR